MITLMAKLTDIKDMKRNYPDMCDACFTCIRELLQTQNPDVATQ